MLWISASTIVSNISKCWLFHFAFSNLSLEECCHTVHLSLRETLPRYKPQHSTVSTIWHNMMGNSVIDLQHCLVHRQIYSMHLFNRSALEPLWRGQLNRRRHCRSRMSYSSHEHQREWRDIHHRTKHCTATKTYGQGKDRGRERASGCRIEWGYGRKV